MNITYVEIDWMERFSNDPNLIVTIDSELPPREETMFDVKEFDGYALYFGVNDPLVRFYCHNKMDERGYGGDIFELKLKSGETRKIKGPWSSRCSVMMQHFDTKCTDITIIDSLGFRWGCHVTLEFAQWAARMIGLEFVERDRGGETSYDITKDQRSREVPFDPQRGG